MECNEVPGGGGSRCISRRSARTSASLERTVSAALAEVGTAAVAGACLRSSRRVARGAGRPARCAAGPVKANGRAPRRLVTLTERSSSAAGGTAARGLRDRDRATRSRPRPGAPGRSTPWASASAGCGW